MIIRGRDDRRRYWHGELVRRGFSFSGRLGVWSHYSHGVFYVAFREESAWDPVYNGIDLSVTVPSDQVLGWVNTFSITILDRKRASENVHHMLDCLVEPDLLPSCVGIDWMGRFLESWMAAR